MRFRPPVTEYALPPSLFSHVTFATFTRIDNDVRVCIPPYWGDHRRTHVS